MLDLGSGAGTDSLVAAQMVGPSGSVTGIDMTPEMLDKARATAAAMGADNVTFIEADAERLPFEDRLLRRRHLQWRDRPDPRQGRGLLARSIRVLVPGGRIQIADVTIQRPVSEEGKKNIDLWTG